MRIGHAATLADRVLFPPRDVGGRPYGGHMRLPDGPDLGLLLVRTNYSDQDAWRRALEAATASTPVTIGAMVPF